MMPPNQSRRRMPAAIPALRTHLELLHESDPELAEITADAYAALRSAQVVAFAAFPEVEPGSPPHHKIVMDVYQTISRDLAASRLDPAPPEEPGSPADDAPNHGGDLPFDGDGAHGDPEGDGDGDPLGEEGEPAGYDPRT